MVAGFTMGAKRILFLCVANSARSQMAEGLARARFGPGVVVASAGSAPRSVHPLALRAMQEIGVDISGQRAKHVDELAGTKFDVVVTLCAEEVCPVYLHAAKRLHWPIDDPAAGLEGLSEAEALERFRRARDQIQQRIEELPPLLENAP
ncbi:Glutaredoxin arsenate reductase [bacterium HR30]|nr:Glutaredoxin arsenate reductase [bacterium HR30]